MIYRVYSIKKVQQSKGLLGHPMNYGLFHSCLSYFMLINYNEHYIFKGWADEKDGNCIGYSQRVISVDLSCQTCSFLLIFTIMHFISEIISINK